MKGKLKNLNNQWYVEFYKEAAEIDAIERQLVKVKNDVSASLNEGQEVEFTFFTEQMVIIKN